MKYTSVTAILLAVGCVSQPPESSTSQLPVGSTYYQAFDEKWKHDPGINPVFETKAEAEEYAEVNGMGNSHSYEVREVDYRYEVRVGFSDYSYSNGSWNHILHTAGDFNDAYEYVVEYSSAHSDLIIFDLNTGKQFEETP
jgi:hypothetical protein